jgi:hypothetical protein
MGITAFAIFLGAVLNQGTVLTTLSILPFIAVRIAIVVLVALGTLFFPARGFSVDSKKEPLVALQIQGFSIFTMDSNLRVQQDYLILK